MKLQKDGKTINLNSDIQAIAFLNSGWVKVESEDKYDTTKKPGRPKKQNADNDEYE